MVEKQGLLTQTHLRASRKEQQLLLPKDVTSTLSVSLEHVPDSMRHLLLLLSLSAHRISVPCHREVFRGNDNDNVPFLRLQHVQLNWRVSAQEVQSLISSCAGSLGICIHLTSHWHFRHRHSYRNILYLLSRQVKECLKPWHTYTHF